MILRRRRDPWEGPSAPPPASRRVWARAILSWNARIRSAEMAESDRPPPAQRCVGLTRPDLRVRVD
jgi:hypothetical protein